MNLKAKITAILVDDETKAIQNLLYLLKQYCKNVVVLAVANNVDDAVKLIHIYRPELVFLDIEMPRKSGFNLFEEISVNFKTIFVTAYSSYAVKAFEVSATDYLLKPIDIDRLQDAIKKVESHQFSSIEKYGVLKKNINSEELNQIVVPYKDTHIVLKLNEITCFEANQSYCKIHTIQNGKVHFYVYSKSLKYFNDLLSDDKRFFRSNRSWLVNLSYIKSFSKKSLALIIEGNIETTISKKKLKPLETLLSTKN